MAFNYTHALALLFGDIPPSLLSDLDPRAPQYIELHSSFVPPSSQTLTQAITILKNLAAAPVPDADAMALLGWCFNKHGPQKVAFSSHDSDLYFKKATFFGSHFAIVQTFRQLSQRQPLDIVQLFVSEIQPIALKGFKRAKYYIGLTYQALGVKSDVKRLLFAQAGAPGKVLLTVIKCFQDLQFQQSGLVCSSDMPTLVSLINFLIQYGQAGWLHVFYPLRVLYLVGHFLKESEECLERVKAQTAANHAPIIAFYFQVGKVVQKWLTSRCVSASLFANDIFL